MLHGFKDYLLNLGKSENTAAAYLRDAKLFLVWCKDSFGDEPKQLHRANIQEYISYMRNVRGYHPKTVNHHLSSLRSLNEYLIMSGRQTEAAVLDSDFMKIQIQYASPCTVEKKDVEAFRQRLLESGSKRDFCIVTLYAYSGIRRSKCVNKGIFHCDLDRAAGRNIFCRNVLSVCIK